MIAEPEVVTQTPFDVKADVTEYAVHVSMIDCGRTRLNVSYR